MSKATEFIRAARQRLDEETLAKASGLSAYQQAVIRELLADYRREQAEMMISLFQTGWSVEMVISQSMSLINALKKIETKLTGESQ